ncbi:MAG: methionine adenosyltransferase [bacterium]|nr:methionine adenosyltransferase [bacterium]
MMSFVFSSESVTEGHPDKICDQISDAILDACLKQDPNSRVGVETAVKDNKVFILGELTSNAEIDAEKIARRVIRDIGYRDEKLIFTADQALVHVALSKQSGDIARGVGKRNGEIGAGDQGMMFGYADLQTNDFLPLPISLAHRLARQLTKVRKTGQLSWLRPDGKTQVTVRYEGNVPKEITAIVVSAQHDPNISLNDLRKAIKKFVIDPVVPAKLLAKKVQILINPTGRFVIGGPVGDSGVTGRKIIVDTYGGWARHGGGAFSGKDATKVDRSGAYAARQVALSVVKKGMAQRCEVQLAYAIGVAQPVSVMVETFGTEIKPKEEIEKFVAKIDFRPAAIIERLNLRKPIFQKTAAYGHFGKPEFSWEKVV